MPRKSPSPLSPSNPSERPLTPDEILVAEFEYAANSAFQANEDRSKVASFFLVAVGSLIAAIFGAQEWGLEPASSLVLAGLFLALTLLGLLTAMQLARLREAWIESARAMNQIKDYYNARFEKIQLSDAYRWRTKTIPAHYKPHSISNYTVIEVALLSGLTFGASAYFFQVGIGYLECLWAITFSAGALAFVLILFIYKRILGKESK